MKVLHINVNYLGSPLHQKLKENLEKLDIDNLIYVPVHSDKQNVFEKNLVVSKCFTKNDRVNYFLKQKKIYTDLKNKVNMSEIDIVHAHTLFTDGNVVYNLKLKFDLPYIVAVRNTDVNTFFKFMFHLRKRGVKILSEASAVIFLSEVYRDRVVNKYVPEKLRDSILKKAYVIPNGIDEFWRENTYRERQDFDNDTLNIVCVGAVNKNKNIVSVIKAVEKLNAEGVNCHLDVAGRPEDKRIIGIIEKYRFAKYHGCLNKEQLIDIYRKNDIFVLPSFRETFGLAYVEAMSQGLPVIYTKGEGFDGQFEEGTVGYSVNPHSIDDICEKIKLVKDNIAALSQNALKGSKKFEWEKIAEQYVRIYKNLMER